MAQLEALAAIPQSLVAALVGVTPRLRQSPETAVVLYMAVVAEVLEQVYQVRIPLPLRVLAAYRIHIHKAAERRNAQTLPATAAFATQMARVAAVLVVVVALLVALLILAVAALLGVAVVAVVGPSPMATFLALAATAAAASHASMFGEVAT